MKIQKTADGFDTLFSEKYNQTYHSIHGVLQESQHVFLAGAGVEARLKSKIKHLFWKLVLAPVLISS